MVQRATRRILDEWRAAERALAHADQDERRLHARCMQLRDEYQRAFDDAQQSRAVTAADATYAPTRTERVG